MAKMAVEVADEILEADVVGVTKAPGSAYFWVTMPGKGLESRHPEVAQQLDLAGLGPV